jgi:outer membrane protein TolC
MSKKICFFILGLAVLAAGAFAQAPQNVLKLTLDDCIVRALQQNIGIQVAVLGPQSSELSVQRAREKYLPSLAFNYNKRNSESASYSFLDIAGTSTVSKTDNYSGAVNQTIPLGGRLSLSMSNGLTDTNQRGNTINPRYNTSLQLSLSQPLLRDFGPKMANRDIIIARNNLDISETQLLKTVQDTVYSVTQAYWNLVYSTENYQVQLTSLQLARDFLAQNRLKVEIGQMAPIDVLSAESQVANIEASILSAESSLKSNEDQLKTLLNLSSEEGIQTIVVVDKPRFEAERPIDLDQALLVAMQKRPDLRISKLDLKNQELNLAYAKNQLLPNLSLSASFSSPGLSGTQLLYDGNPLFGNVIGTVPGGFSSAYRDSLGFKYPNWNIGLTLDINLSNYLSKATFAIAQVSMKQTLLNMENTEKQAVLEIKNAIRQLQTSYKQIQAYKVARELAEKKLAGEEEKLRLGQSTNYVVLQYQRDLTSARVAELQSIINYNIAQTGIDRATGVLLETKNIKVADLTVK